MQAIFITLAYNLSHLLHTEIAHTEQIIDERNVKKRAQRLTNLKEQLGETKCILSSLRESLQDASQLSVKFYRWLRNQVHNSRSWPQALAQLRLIYAHF